MKRLTLTALAFMGMMAVSCDSLPMLGGKAEPALETTNDSVSYAIGVRIAQNISENNEDSLNFKALMAGLRSSLEAKDLKITPEEADQVIQAYFQGKQEREVQNNEAASMAFLAENAKRENVKTTATGLQYEVLKDATGEKPLATSKVKVHYHGTLIDGKVFDSSVDRGEPVEFELDKVIPGWGEGLQLMSVGSKYKFYIPSALAYGPGGAGGAIPPNSALVFEVELIEILK